MSLYARPGDEAGGLDHLAGTLPSLGVTQEDIRTALTAHRDETVPEPLAAS
jgi:hypothetical protein